MSVADHFWLSEAIRVSRLAPRVTDRYAVGAVIVGGDGSVLATGYTGETHPHHHAEEEALARLAGRPVPDLSGATLYTSLEPCTARRSRPATCSRLILDAGVGRVVLAWREPILFADCDGVETLRRHGVEVLELPELADQVRAVNSHVLLPSARLEIIG
ncbi:deaminase [Actinoplanes subglobosus]|uniref:Deaminase n=1 Tax=Actinoplanes subglobosus TaxID=1547892 RepID=A0ABV8J5R3_9ACTN